MYNTNGCDENVYIPLQCIDENIFCADHEVMIFDGSLSKDDVCDAHTESFMSRLLEKYHTNRFSPLGNATTYF